MDRMLMKGNEAIAEAALRAGVQAYFGYPITPQSELPEYMARELDRRGGVFLQAESEVAAINMVYGAGGAGARGMTSTSSPGVSLMQEGLSYLVGSEVPCVVVNMARGGPGLGNIAPAQSDYFQATKSAGHGRGRPPVAAPPTPVTRNGDAPWATTGAGDGPRRLINSIHLEPDNLERHNLRLLEKYRRAQQEVRWEAYRMDDAAVAVAAYGLAARVARSAVDRARAKGIAAGLLRPVTLFPFPTQADRQAAERARALLAVEMSAGQRVGG